MASALMIAFGVLTVWNMFEHAVGSYFLFRRRKEFLLLVLFSICNFTYAAINLGFVVIVITNTPQKVFIIYATLFRIPFYWLMMMLTVERFLVVFLHLRYGKSMLLFLMFFVMYTLPTFSILKTTHYFIFINLFAAISFYSTACYEGYNCGWPRCLWSRTLIWKQCSYDPFTSHIQAYPYKLFSLQGTTTPCLNVTNCGWPRCLWSRTPIWKQCSYDPFTSHIQAYPYEAFLSSRYNNSLFERYKLWLATLSVVTYAHLKTVFIWSFYISYPSISL